jgi:hypothetical protein
MDTSQIKRFAVEARNILKQGVINRITALGFDEKGEVAERNKPQHLQGKTLFMGQLYDENFYGKWMALYNRVRTKGVKEVYEEAAYTWFNRMMAIRIMEKNGFTDPVLSFDDDRLRIPRIVSNARAGQVYISDESDREKLSELLMDDTKTTEQFTLLITAFCHSNPVINNCFGGVSDYTEILLPTNILSEGGFVDLLNHTAFITDDDYRQSELIGWLYQFYISEKKDEVFASFKGGKKAEAEDIPAATQIFTPNWIVKYMVQNTVGRIFLDNNPSSDLKDKWKYLVEPSTPTPDDCIFKYDDPKELTMADLGCGSGHILNEGFDILYDIYIEEGYSRKQAIENIFKYNLTGIDLDTRAKQLATFALMMKACQKDDSFLDCHIMPNVLDMPDVDRYSFIEADGHFCCAYSLEWDNEQKNKIHLELVSAFELLKQAHNLGSIMKFDLSNSTMEYIKRCVKVYEEDPKFQNPFATLIHAYKLILALTHKYASLAMNPPYMGSGNMNADLSQYVTTNYPDGKADLMTVFMEKAWSSMLPLGSFAMINLPSWMFIASFVELRKTLVNNFQIESLLHLGRGIFGSDFGTVAFVVKNTIPNNSGIYRRLFKEHVQVRSVEQIRQLFFEQQYGRYVTCQSVFNHIKGTPIGYWATPQIIKAFSGKLLSSFGVTRKGMYTGCNATYVRSWTEVSDTKVGFHYTVDTYKESGKKWFPYANGGEFRKWYGNFNDVVLWENDGEELKSARNSNGKMQAGCFNVDYIFKEGIFWSSISAKQYSMKYLPLGHLFSSASNAWFPYDPDTIRYILANVNSKVSREIMNILNPTLNYNAGDITNIPIIIENRSIVEGFTKENISISKQDWDAHETSWDFASNELLSINESNFLDIIADYADYEGCCIDPAPAKPNSLEWHLNMYHKKWETKFQRLHQNEEELNRQFIEIYGLQDELTPDVPMDEITILQQGEISIEDNQIVWHDDVVIKQLISYAIGCMMGRYRLDREGLWIAHPNPTSDEICTYHYNGYDYTIDDDGIMPLMSRDCGFDDNGVLRFSEFLRVAFGEKELTENLNFVEKCLGKTIEDYLKKDFWKDHKKMYQNRPIYWLFSSKKGAFQVLAYMHRMNPYTVEQIRNKYLLPHIDYITKKIDEMEMKEATLSTSERKTLQKLKTDLAECQEYHERLHLVADQQVGFDLDDGVVVNYAKFGDVVAKIK